MQSEIPFNIYISQNVELFEFNHQWDHLKHYHAVFNSQHALISKYFQDKERWAMVADWRQWIVQVPEAERLCIRTVDQFVDQGMTHYAVLSDGHPVAKWQAQRVKEQNPRLVVEIFENKEECLTWLSTIGFSIDFTAINFDPTWLRPSLAFRDILRSLDMEKSRFTKT